MSSDFKAQVVETVFGSPMGMVLAVAVGLLMYAGTAWAAVSLGFGD
jgi:hypothetical protein